MATLQTTQRGSAYMAKSRLSQVCRDKPTPGKIIPLVTLPLDQEDTVVARGMASASAQNARQAGQYTEQEQNDLLLRTAFSYTEWRLVSISKHEHNMRVAYLVHICDGGEPGALIKSGRAMRIVVDGVGDLKIYQPVRRSQKLAANSRSWWRKLVETLRQ